LTLSLYADGKTTHGVVFAGRVETRENGAWRKAVEAFAAAGELSMAEVQERLPGYDAIEWDDPPIAHHSLDQIQIRGSTDLMRVAVTDHSPTGIQKPSAEQAIDFGQSLAAVRDAVWGR